MHFLRALKLVFLLLIGPNLMVATAQNPTLGFTLEQLQAEAFLQKGLTGKGIKIGIIDGGFLKANEESSLRHFFQTNRVKAYRDYVTPELAPYDGIKRLDDGHGTEVWQLIGGYDPTKNIQYGLATEAEFYLARTDHGAYEKRLEEEHLIAALDWMYAEGVRLVNISLGYNKGYTDANENYETSQMDGQTTAIARAIEAAALERGMLVVVAAGNEAGDESWQIVSTPGDAPHALTVGSSKLEVWDKMGYSSIGPEFVDFVKPDVSVYSTLGTSFAAPVITGLVACLWQLDTSLTNLQTIEILKKAGSLHPYPNNYLGHGVPTCPAILQVMKGAEPPRPETLASEKAVCVLRIDEKASYAVAFHKKDEWRVLQREVYRPAHKKVKIRQPESAVQTTVVIGKRVVEIFWE